MAQLLLANPRKRRATKRRKSPARKRALSTITRVTKRYRRNPSRRGGDIMALAKKGALGGAGAFAVDVVMNKIPQLGSLGGAQFQPIVRAAVGVGVGMIVAKVGKNKKMGTDLAEGAITVQMYNLMKSTMGAKMGVSGYDDDGLLGYDDDGLLGMEDEMGYFSPAPTYNTPEMGYFEDDDY